MAETYIHYLEEYLTAYSGYGIALVMAFYTLVSFLVTIQKLPFKDFFFGLQRSCIFIIQFLLFANLILGSGEKKYFLLYLFVQLLLGALFLLPMIYKHCSRILVSHMAMLLGIGFCIISRLSFDKAIRQYAITLISVAVSLFLPLIVKKCTFLKKLGWLYGLLGIFLLAGVLILGEVTHGSKITYTIQDITFQPSEFVKILFVFFLAAFLQEKVTFPKVLLTSVLAGAQILILVLSKDLGSALIFFVAYLGILYTASGNVGYLFLGLLGLSGASVMAYELFEHIQIRVLAWKDPWTYIDAQGYQITQSLFAIDSGGWFGMGLLKGNPSAIPYVEADFIFSAVCEELGVCFGICLILVCLSAFLTMMNLALRQKQAFYRLAAYGLGVIYIFQIFLTVGGGIKFIPLTGVTLPFVSYGGSSVMTSVILFFVMHGMSEIANGKGEKKRVKDSQRKQSKTEKEC